MTLKSPPITPHLVALTIAALALAGAAACSDDGSAETTDIGPLGDAGADAASGGGDHDAALAADSEPGPDGDAESAGGDALDGVGDLSPCEPALEITPASSQALPLSLVTFGASGGTGAYRFAAAAAPSGGLVHAYTGAYLVGTEAGVTDVVELRDDGCAGSAIAEVEVVWPMTVRPGTAEVPPKTSFQFEVDGGSGEVEYELLWSGSGGMVSAGGGYEAGYDPGEDAVRVLDLETGQEAMAYVNVADGAALTPAPPWIALGLGQTWHLQIEGGSGHFSYEVAKPLVIVDEAGALEAVDEGRTAIEVVDVFAGLEALVVVDVSAPRTSPLSRAGDQSATVSVASAGDIDGDGFGDLLVGRAEADVGALNGGAVYIYRGGEAGVEPSPARVLSSSVKAEEWGRGLAVGDFDGDGLGDLAVGAPGTNPGVNDGGAVLIYPGVDGALYAETPSQLLAGTVGGFDLGTTLAACDFNGDGIADLAAAAMDAEDTSAPDVASNQGGVFVYLGGAGDGLPALPTLQRWGQEIDDGQLVPAANLRLGWDLAAGDYDGDGLCDLVATTIELKTNADGAQDGGAFLYRGIAADGDSPGGLEPWPSRVWAGNEPDNLAGRFGRSAAMGDLDGDGKAEVIIGQTRRDTPGVSGTDHGTAHVFLGKSYRSDPADKYRSAENADWQFLGDSSGDYVGWDVAVGDVTGDGRDDLLVGALRDELPEAPGNTGLIYVFAGVEGGLPSPEPTLVIGGAASDDYFATAVAAIPDVDGDGVGDILTFADRDDTFGYDVGRPYVATSGSAWSLLGLDHPGQTSGYQVAFSVAILGDVTGSSFEDLAVGAPTTHDETCGADCGAVYIHEGSSVGFDEAPTVTLSGFSGHSGSDFFGYAVADAGDFDGDGIRDVAVLSMLEDLPASLGEPYGVQGTCAFDTSNVGAAYVFRGTKFGSPVLEPSFVFYGPQAGQRLEALAGGVDVDGDGFDDLVVGSYRVDRPEVDNAGAVMVVHGRPAPPQGQIVAICPPYFTHIGVGVNEWIGWSVTGIGDLDGDGCDEFAAGAPEDSLQIDDEGAVTLFHGWGGPGCPAAPGISVLRSGLIDAKAGFALDGGHDVDGDGLPDLLVGSPTFEVSGVEHGAMWLVTGDYLASLPIQPLLDGLSPSVQHPLVPPGQPHTRYRVVGALPGERLGQSVALVPDMGFGDLAGMLAGAPGSRSSGVDLAGGAKLFRFDPDPGSASWGMSHSPILEFGGETGRPGGSLGRSAAAGLVSGDPMIVVGGHEASGVSLDNGACYAFELDLLIE